MSHSSVFEEYQVDLIKKKEKKVVTLIMYIFSENVMFHKC